MLPDEPGTYALIIRNRHPTSLSVGKLGEFTFEPGWYGYAGSARGPGGLAARIARHASRSKTCHWHIDYLLAEATCEAAWYAIGPTRRECAWAEALTELPRASIPAPRFGASDCRCAAHLIHFAVRPAFSTFAGLVPSTVLRAVLTH